MELLICIAAAVVAWVVRSLWYMLLETPRQRLAGAPVRNTGDPRDASLRPYLAAGACLLVMALFLRALFLHVGVSSMTSGLGLGLGIGALIGLPLTLLQAAPHPRGGTLALIDAGHAVLVCGTLGLILGAL